MSYLVLTRRRQEKIFIGDDIEIVYIGAACACGNDPKMQCGCTPQVKIAIRAPENVVILREEVKNRTSKKITSD